MAEEGVRVQVNPDGGQPDNGRRAVGLSITYGRSHIELEVAGEFDFRLARRFAEAVQLCVDERPPAVRVDGRGVSRVGLAGVIALGNAYLVCRERQVRFELQLRPEGRRVLDVVGLWWLGVIDGPPSARKALAQATATYLDLFERDGTLRKQSV